MFNKTARLIAATAAFVAATASIATYAPIGVTDLEATELIVKLAPGQKLGATPAEVIDIVKLANAGNGTNFAVFTRVASPVTARWMIHHRLPEDYLAKLHDTDPDHPEWHLQQFIVLGYPTPEQRIGAEQQMKVDPAIASLRPNAKQAFSARVNDYFVQDTVPIVSERYQWALEAVKAMSPASNPGQASGWDLARGFGYVAVVDSGIQAGNPTANPPLPMHPDLRNNVRLHFSQAFYTAACPNGNLTDVDEAASAPTCPNTVRGHGTHVAGLIAATPNNKVTSGPSPFHGGTAGVCWNCSLIIAKAFQNDEGRDSEIINGVYHGIIRGASVINRSGGAMYLSKYGVGVTRCSQVSGAGIDDGYCNAVALAERREIMIVAASGNDNKTTEVGFPSSEPTVLSVGATVDFENLWINDILDGELVGTNRNAAISKPELVAPGKRVVSTFYTGGTWRSFCRDGNNADLDPVGLGYDECTGTSMATPVVAGVVAIARSVNPLLSRSDLATRVRNTARMTASGYKMPDTLAAVQNVMVTNSSISPMFAMVTLWGNNNRFYTSSPQMARAAIAGTMLPTLNQSTVPVYYSPDFNAATTTGYSEFPDTAGAILPPRAYFKVWTRFKIGDVEMVPLYRLSKLQNRGDGKDECGFNMPLPSKPIPVQHVYTTNVDELAALQTATNGNCFKLDGIEGYVASYNMTGALEELYRLYNPAADSFILVPTSKIALANSLGYTHYAWWLGWVVPN